MKKSLFILLFPMILFSQELEINILSNNINTTGSEFNFVQINENTAFYSSSRLERNEYQSGIYKTRYNKGEWQKGKYQNFETSSSVANISYSENNGVRHLSLCDNSNNCKIATVNNQNSKIQVLNNNINLEGFNNTQPHTTINNKQKVMYFVSDREGGFGGLDIWLSIIDKNGNYGIPINAGKNINSNADEITPFFNIHEGVLYFSSNKKGGQGGFDIYKSKGSLNLWESPKNAIKFNSEYDELYLIFHKKEKGYFASNRAEKICCNDVYTFQYKIELEGIIEPPTYLKYLPLRLYFHNDEPDSRTMKKTTKKTYKDAYISYFKMQEEYTNISKDTMINRFFSDSLQANFNKLNLILKQILVDLYSGKEIEIQIKGYASPLHEAKYNINLSKRRIMSLINFINSYESNAFQPYILSKKFRITIKPFGESRSAKKINDNPRNTKKSIFGIDAMLERKIEITNIIHQ